MLSPQGYLLGKDPHSKNPFWDEGGEDSSVNRIFATATVDGTSGAPSVDTTKSVNGNNITFGFDFHGLKGAKGDTGPQGPQGVQGPQGIQGIQGEQGETGPQGRDGLNGVQGEPGPEGPRGERGATGPAGPQGPRGETGAAGADGVSPDASVERVQGGAVVQVTDANGTTRAEIYDGNDGVSPSARVEQITGQNACRFVVTDASGTTEATLTGEAGAVGPQGPQGETGPAGPQGPQGIQGERGETGATGATGETGPAGPQGQQGPKGDPGTPGQNGITPVISATATVDGTSGTPSVNVTKGGTDAAPSFAFAFSGLKGESGQGGGGLKIITGTFNRTADSNTHTISNDEWGRSWQSYAINYYTWDDNKTDQDIRDLIRAGKVIRAYYIGRSSVAGVYQDVCAPLEAITITTTSVTSVSEAPSLVVQGSNNYVQKLNSKIVLYVQE